MKAGILVLCLIFSLQAKPSLSENVNPGDDKDTIGTLSENTDINHPSGSKIRCNENYGVFFEETQSCYKAIMDDKLNFARAYNLCREWGAHITSIHSGTENEFVLGLAATMNSSNYRTWIGMIKGNAGKFIWTDGSKVDYTAWEINTIVREPNGVGEEEYCVELTSAFDRWRHSSAISTWNDDLCRNRKEVVVCKKPVPLD